MASPGPDRGRDTPAAGVARRPLRRVISVARRRPKVAQAERALGLMGGLAALVGMGTVLLWLPISAANEPLSLSDALFTAVSAVATTGLTVVPPGEALSLFGQIVLMVLMQLGGVGFMVAAVVIFRLIGRRVTFAERLTLRDSLGLLSARQILRLTTRALLAVLLIETIGALILWFNWRAEFGAGWAAYYAVFDSVSAFTNASFDLFAGTTTAAAGFPTDTLTLLTLAALIVLGGIGIPVIADALLYPQRRSVTLHTRVTLVTAGALIVVGTVLFFLTETRHASAFSDESPGRLMLLSFFHAVAARTSGFTVSAQFSQLAPANGFLLVVLMFIGASPASMGGGITTSTFAILLLALWSLARGRNELRAGRRTIPAELLRKAAAIATGAAILIALVTWLLLYSQENVSLIAALIEAVSAFSTTGYSLGLTSRLDLFGRLLIAGLMFFGRLGTLTIIVLLTQPTVSPAISYREERILLG